MFQRSLWPRERCFNCIWFLGRVFSKEEVDAPDSFCSQSVDLNHFFEEDGKIYGYQGLKITIWVSSICFHAYAEITFQNTSDGGKGDYRSEICSLVIPYKIFLLRILLRKRRISFKHFQPECDYVKSIVSKAEILQQNTTNGHNSDSNSYLKTDCSDLEVIQAVVGTMPVGHLYSRLVPLVLILVDGSNQLRLLGFAAIYRFYHYRDSLRLRLSQILVLPPYQREGYGRHLLEGRTWGLQRSGVIEFPTDYDQEMSFVMFRCTNGEASRIEMDENQTNQEQQLKGLVDKRMKEIKSIAQKVCPRSS
ncbi:Histone acetyltransferase type B catalytic subunit [Camellia lanceoleosa]|uniref:Histone acetyltransferase type B catalytic subunit n=1 Tax=Camellia lanceoleosa TaxID=1840588 RepID=A0ACC0GUG6_9ERIC|nr:Histone acetyltransferase type B catalytic subunit [Camellia lanceoleosa]